MVVSREIKEEISHKPEVKASDMGMFSGFPSELYLHLFSFLEIKHLIALELVSKTMREAARTNWLWFSMFANQIKLAKVNYDENIDFKNTIKNRMKLQVELTMFREAASTLVKEYEGNNKERHAFIQFFFKLANITDTPIELDCNLPKALIGALTFELEMQDQNVDVLGVWFPMSGNRGNYYKLLNTNLEKLKTELRLDDPIGCIAEFYHCIEKAPEGFLKESAFSADRDNLLKDIKEVQAFSYEVASNRVTESDYEHLMVPRGFASPGR